MSNRHFISVSDLATLWGVHVATIQRRIACGDIKAINVAPKGSPVKRWKIPASEANRPGMIEVAEPVKSKKQTKKK
jgi:hypothetical protein